MGAFSLLFSGCAILHHVQVGQIDNRTDTVTAIPFEILMSEAGVSTQEIGAIARSANTKQGDQAAGIAEIIALFQMGPRTGNPVYSERYAEKLIYEIHQKCPTGRVTGLMSIREMRKYPVISGEIVKVTGYCLKDRTSSKTTASTTNSGASL